MRQVADLEHSCPFFDDELVRARKKQSESDHVRKADRRCYRIVAEELAHLLAQPNGVVIERAKIVDVV